MADRKFRSGQVLDPFDLEQYPMMSQQLIEAAPSVFGDTDPNLLQAANRVLVGGPLDIFDLAMRAGDVGMRGLAEGIEYATGLPGVRRDIYGMLTAGGLSAGTSPSIPPSARVSPSRTRGAPQPSTPEGIMAALPAPEPRKALPAPKAIEGEIVSGPTDKYIMLKAEQDKALSQARKSQLQEDLNFEAFRDAFDDARRIVDDEIGEVIRRDEYLDRAPDTEDFFDTLQDVVLFDVDQGMSMGDALAKEMPQLVKYYQDEYGMFFYDGAAKDLMNRMAPKLDEYGFDVTKTLKRREEGEQARREMEKRRGIARAETRQLEEERAMGITPDMTPEERTAAMMAAKERIYREATEAQNIAAGMGIPEETSAGPPKLTVIEGGNTPEQFKREFSYDVYHGQRDPESSIGLVKTKDGREVLVEDATGEFGGINAFESSSDKFPSMYPTDLGTWVTESKNVANYFAGDRGAVYPLKMRMERPKRYRTYEDLEEALRQFDDTEAFVNYLKQQNHDGIQIVESFTDIPETRSDYVVFEGNQLRSVNAKFDPSKRSSKNITYKNGGVVYNSLKQGIGAF